MTLRALIFDVDGTLAETEELHRACFNAAFAEAGLDWLWEPAEYRRLLAVTGGKERIRAHERALGTLPMDEDTLASLHARKTALYGERMAAGEVRLRPGVDALIREARARGLALAVATTTSRPNVDALCRAAWGSAAESVFDAVAAGDEVAAKKPAPDVYRLALRRLGIGPSEALAFEDSEAGVSSAKAAGIRVVAAPSLYTAHQDLSAAAVLVPDLADPGVLELAREI